MENPRTLRERFQKFSDVQRNIVVHTSKILGKQHTVFGGLSESEKPTDIYVAFSPNSANSGISEISLAHRYRLFINASTAARRNPHNTLH